MTEIDPLGTSSIPTKKPSKSPVSNGFLGKSNNGHSATGGILPHDSNTIPNGLDLLRTPSLNKGRAFSKEERERFHLRGLLPPRITSFEEQSAFTIKNLRSKLTDLDRYNSLVGLQDRNETLFYRVLIDHLEELMPIVYTPTVGLACQKFGGIYRRSHGMYISTEDRGHIRKILDNWPIDDVRVIVVTDGERILGLGDLGVHGMGIPIGKLSLYTACAGVKPSMCLPITLDVGTDNEELLEDERYLGLPHKRVRGPEYDAFIDEFIEAATDRFPNVLIQFEDFGNTNAFRLLEKYKNNFCVFNDDIQGTASVTLAGIFSALRMKQAKLADQTILLFGAGEAASGISDLIVLAMMKEGVPEAEARKKCWLMDSKGLVVKRRTNLAEHKIPYAHEHEPIEGLANVVNALHPTILIGASGQARTFTEEALRMMASYVERPIIFALSNPTSQSECTAEEAYRFTDGHAIFASGSPFPATEVNGKAVCPGQANNAYIFPGLGIGVIASGARRITSEMFYEAAKTLSAQASEDDFAIGRLFPCIDKTRTFSARIAAAVAHVAYRSGLARNSEPKDLLGYMESHMYDPVYRPYV